MEKFTEESLKAKISELEDASDQKIRQLEQKMKELEERYEPIPQSEYSLAKYDFNDKETAVLRLISIGVRDAEAIRLSGLDPAYIRARTQQSVQFATAYSELKSLFQEWQEARLKFTMTDVWNRIDDIINTDAASYIEVAPTFARNILQSQAKIINQLVRLNYAKESKVAVTHTMSAPMLQLQSENAGIIAAILKDLSYKESEGTLDSLLPEHQIIELTIDDYPTFRTNPVDDEGRLKCLECDIYVEDLASHLHLEHEMAITTYERKHSIEPGTLLT